MPTNLFTAAKEGQLILFVPDALYRYWYQAITSLDQATINGT
ncbi:MAG: hypothetical protein RI580_13425 [Halothece sp. Uz-M2-17]|nr:hypothetical protein [Halothece sp. Uz-M2-17]